MWILLEVYNDGAVPTTSKFSTKSKALEYIKQNKYEMGSKSVWETENCETYEQDLHICYLFNPKNLVSKDI